MHCDVEGELKPGQVYVPRTMVITYLLSEHCLYHSILTLHGVRLRAVRRGCLQLDTPFLRKSLEQSGCELRSVIRKQEFRGPIPQKDDVLHRADSVLVMADVSGFILVHFVNWS